MGLQEPHQKIKKKPNFKVTMSLEKAKKGKQTSKHQNTLYWLTARTASISLIFTWTCLFWFGFGGVFFMGRKNLISTYTLFIFVNVRLSCHSFAAAAYVMMSSTSCVRLFTVACTAKHHVIWPTSSRRLPQQVSDPPLLALLQRHVPSHHLVTARSLLLLRALGTSCRHHFVEFILLTLSNTNCKTFLFAFLIFQLLHTVNRPCCISRTYVAVIFDFLIWFWFERYFLVGHLQACDHCQFKRAQDYNWSNRAIIIAADYASNGLYNFIVPLRSHARPKTSLNPIILLLEKRYLPLLSVVE